MARPTVAGGIAQIRAARKLALVSTEPFRWEILSTDGTYKHQLVYSELAEEIVCETCSARHGTNRCWARARVLADLTERFGPEVKANG